MRKHWMVALCSVASLLLGLDPPIDAAERLTWQGKQFAAEEQARVLTERERSSAANRPGRIYAVVPVWKLDRAGGPHVCTWGVVSFIAKDLSGDWYLRISDGRWWVEARVIPRLPVALPALGTTVNVCGVRNMDEAARWEIHPVEYITPAAQGKDGRQ